MREDGDGNWQCYVGRKVGTHVVTRSKDGDEKGKMLERAANRRTSGVIIRVVTDPRRHLFPDACQVLCRSEDPKSCTVH